MSSNMRHQKPNVSGDILTNSVTPDLDFTAPLRSLLQFCTWSISILFVRSNFLLKCFISLLRFCIISQLCGKYESLLFLSEIITLIEIIANHLVKTSYHAFRLPTSLVGLCTPCWSNIFHYHNLLLLMLVTDEWSVLSGLHLDTVRNAVKGQSYDN